MSIADTMVSNGMKDLGYEYINLDGTYVTRVVTKEWKSGAIPLYFFFGIFL